MFKAKKLLIFTMVLFLLLTACTNESKNSGFSGNTVENENNSEIQRYESQVFAMSTIVTQTVYGKDAQKAALEFNSRLADFEKQYSLFSENGDIAKINKSAGGKGVKVSSETASFLEKALTLSLQYPSYFAITIEPISGLWGINSDNPYVPKKEEIDELLPLVDDSAININNNIVTLPKEGMAIDLGGIAKGEVCSIAKEIYEKYDIDGALLYIGGNIYAYGEKPNGDFFRIGFRNPLGNAAEYIASFDMKDITMATSGGYERKFEKDGETYIHIMNPVTGYPAQSDIIEIGVLHEDGATADFYSTALFVGGTKEAIAYMQNGGLAMFIDENNNFYVSKALEDNFKLESPESYNLIFI